MEDVKDVTKLDLEIEKLEPRIAPGGANHKGNNGFGNGGDDGSNAGKQDGTR